MSRAVRYLSAEVPSWSKENGCFSCHNNGDAARALMAAGKKGIALKAEALEDTLIRTTLAEVKLPQYEAAFRGKDFHPRRSVARPVSDQGRRKWMLEFRQHGRRYKDSVIEQLEELDVADQDKVVDRRRVCNDDDRGRVQR